MLVKKHKGPSIKDVRTKIDPSLSEKMSALVKHPLPLSVRAHHKFRKFRRFLHQRVRSPHPKNPRSPCPHWTNFPLTTDVLYGHFGQSKNKLRALQFLINIQNEYFGKKIFNFYFLDKKSINTL